MLLVCIVLMTIRPSGFLRERRQRERERVRARGRGGGTHAPESLALVAAPARR